MRGLEFRVCFWSLGDFVCRCLDRALILSRLRKALGIYEARLRVSTALFTVVCRFCGYRVKEYSVNLNKTIEGLGLRGKNLNPETPKPSALEPTASSQNSKPYDPEAGNLDLGFRVN